MPRTHGNKHRRFGCEGSARAIKCENTLEMLPESRGDVTDQRRLADATDAVHPRFENPKYQQTCLRPLLDRRISGARNEDKGCAGLRRIIARDKKKLTGPITAN